MRSSLRRLMLLALVWSAMHGLLIAQQSSLFLQNRDIPSDSRGIPSDFFKPQLIQPELLVGGDDPVGASESLDRESPSRQARIGSQQGQNKILNLYRQFMKLESENDRHCLLYTSPSPRDLSTSRMPSSA